MFSHIYIYLHQHWPTLSFLGLPDGSATGAAHPAVPGSLGCTWGFSGQCAGDWKRQFCLWRFVAGGLYAYTPIPTRSLHFKSLPLSIHILGSCLDHSFFPWQPVSGVKWSGEWASLLLQNSHYPRVWDRGSLWFLCSWTWIPCGKISPTRPRVISAAGDRQRAGAWRWSFCSCLCGRASRTVQATGLRRARRRGHGSGSGVAWQPGPRKHSLRHIFKTF